MMRTRVVHFFAATGLCLLAACGEPTALPANKPSSPNVLLVVADDLGFSDLASYGGEIPTPNIERLAARGSLFTQFRTAPSCAPTRAMLLTGMDAHRTGMGIQGGTGMALPEGFTEHPSYRGHLGENVVTVASRLQRAGYFTFTAGKWHLGLDGGSGPESKGFMRSFGIPYGGGNHFNTLGYKETTPTIEYYENGEAVLPPPGHYSTDTYTDKLIEYVDEALDHGQPFFGYAAYTAPHWPLQVPESLIGHHLETYAPGWDAIRAERFAQLKKLRLVPEHHAMPPRWHGVPAWDTLSHDQQRVEVKTMAIYAAMVARLDESIGRLVTALEEREVLANTIIVFLSDNGAAGENFTDPNHPWYAWINENYDLHSEEKMGGPESFVMLGRPWAQVSSAHLYLHKGVLYDGGIRVPLIIVDPRAADRRPRVDAPWDVTGIAPSILEWSGVGGEWPDDRALRPTGIPLSQLLAGNTAMPPIAQSSLGSGMIIEDDWKAVRVMPPYGPGTWQLFNIASDPGEQEDLSHEHPKILEPMVEHFANFEHESGVLPVPEGWNPYRKLLPSAEQ